MKNQGSKLKYFLNYKKPADKSQKHETLKKHVADCFFLLKIFNDLTTNIISDFFAIHLWAQAFSFIYFIKGLLFWK